jgi:peroxiredoxin
VIEQGKQAPDFELPDQDGSPVRLSGLRGRRVVLPNVKPKQHDELVLAAP